MCAARTLAYTPEKKQSMVKRKTRLSSSLSSADSVKEPPSHSTHAYTGVHVYSGEIGNTE